MNISCIYSSNFHYAGIPNIINIYMKLFHIKAISFLYVLVAIATRPPTRRDVYISLKLFPCIKQSFTDDCTTSIHYTFLYKWSPQSKI